MSNFPFSQNSPLLLVGCGNMGSAMARGWIKAGLDAKAFFSIDPFYADKHVDGLPNEQIVANVSQLPKGFCPKAVVMAIKPQMMAEGLPELGSIIQDSTLIISVAAGTTMALYSEYFGDVGVIRAMPNTPAAIGKGITGMVANKTASAEDKAVAEQLLSAIGEVVWVEEEALIDSVTSVSGSGPAYVFYFVEALTAAGVSSGLSEDVAMKLARQTIVGAGALLEASEDSAAELRRKVTSPKGTTAAALDVLMAEDGLAPVIRRAVSAAKQRSEELS